MSEFWIDSALIEKALDTERWTLLTRAGVDVSSIGTWDRVSERRTRLLVPIDVQAFVSTPGGEATVDVSGGPGDPVPFASANTLAPGVYLHWAMPDALLTGRDDGAGELELPRLPDRWAVIRVLFPEGRGSAITTGWVLDSVHARVLDLGAFNGAFSDVDTPGFEPLDAAVGGSLTWTASRSGATGRFAFHDALDLTALSDRAPNGFHGKHAVYVVAGWWSDLAGDPIAATIGPAALRRRLAELGWTDAPDTATASPDPDRRRLQQRLAAKKSKSAKVVAANGAAVSIAATAGVALPIAEAAELVVFPDQPTYAALLHGAVMGVPIDATLGADGRPVAADCSTAIGIDTDDVVAAFAAPALAVDRASREALERLTAAFASGMLDRLRTADGLEELAEREHDDGFRSFPGPALPLATPDRLRADDSVALGPTAVGRKGRGARAAASVSREPFGVSIAWTRTVGLKQVGGKGAPVSKGTPATPRTSEATVPPVPASPRTVAKPAPRLFRPRPPMIAIRGARPDHRHHGDGLFDESGRLFCRYGSQCQTDMIGVVSGTAVLPSLGSGALPDEVLDIVREAILLNPYGHRWLADAGAAGRPGTRGAYGARTAAEVMLRFGATGTYDGSSHVRATTVRAPRNATWESVRGIDTYLDTELTAVLAAHSLLSGIAPSPIAVSTWRQPWVPMWLEWRASVQGTTTLRGWSLDGLDLESVLTSDGGATVTRTLSGRSPLNQGVSRAMQTSIADWVRSEQARSDGGVLGPGEEATLARVGTLIGPADIVSTSLDGLGEQLLGIPYVGVLARSGPENLPDATEAPLPLFGGTLQLEALRLVDAFGRVLDLPVAAVTTVGLEAAGASMRLRPRFLHAARWLFRLVDPAHPSTADPAVAKEAFVDQVAPELAINPVAGFLLPDHIDESVEVFGADGSPLGQVAHDPISGAVLWEPAPGRPLPPDAGPYASTTPAQRVLADIATGLVVADVRSRHAARDDSTVVSLETPLTALLRAVDTTMWSVDTYATLGTSAVSALTGRPIAVVRATLRLHVPDDVDEVDVVAPGGPEARQAAFAALNSELVPVRLGELRRSDDALLGFFVDDDHEHFHVVDKVVASNAIVSGRHQGHLGQLGATKVVGTAPIVHEYLVAEDTLWVRPGQVLRLTLLMLPAGKVHLTSGVLPRKAIALADDWVTPGLRRIAPSVRIGPVLVDPTEIRLPLVHTLGEKQTFTRRDGPLTWRDDPIVAASQTAYLPTLPHEAQEGWVRVTPLEPPASTASSTPPAPVTP